MNTIKSGLAFTFAVHAMIISSTFNQAATWLDESYEPATEAYIAEVEAWRTAHEDRLKSDNGWVAVVGLHWLKQGENRFGSDPSNDIVLPQTVSPIAGTFQFRGEETKLIVKDKENILVNGKSADDMVLKIDSLQVESNTTDLVTIDRLSLQLIKRGLRYGIRVRNPLHPHVINFKGCKWYPVDEAFRIQAKFTAYPDGKTVAITNVLGDKRDSELLGTVEFEYAGKTYQLDAERESEDELLINFRDSTNSNETYQAGRFLIIPKPVGESVILDFNKAHNAPCAVSQHTTCPLPPPQNSLPFAIKAGEKRR